MSTFLPVRFSQSACLNKFGFFASFAMATTLAMAMRASHWFSGPFNDPFLSGVVTGLFLRVRCTPQQNSQCQFWASVCVNNLNRCKTSFCGIFPGFWFVPNNKLQGDHPCTMCDGPTKRPQYMWISRLITVTYLLFHVHVLQWDVANPRTTKPFSNNWFCNLHGCRNLSREVTTWFRWISCF